MDSVCGLVLSCWKTQVHLWKRWSMHTNKLLNNQRLNLLSTNNMLGGSLWEFQFFIFEWVFEGLFLSLALFTFDLSIQGQNRVPMNTFYAHSGRKFWHFLNFQFGAWGFPVHYFWLPISIISAVISTKKFANFTKLPQEKFLFVNIFKLRFVSLISCGDTGALQVTFRRYSNVYLWLFHSRYAVRHNKRKMLKKKAPQFLEKSPTVFGFLLLSVEMRPDSFSFYWMEKCKQRDIKNNCLGSGQNGWILL